MYAFRSFLAVSSLLVALNFIASGCRTPDSGASAVLDSDSNTLGLGLSRIDTRATFDLVAKDASGLIKGGKAVKFLIDRRNPQAPRVWFINGNFKENGEVPEHAKFHFYFAKKHLNIPEDANTFNSVTYFRTSKRYLAGTINTYRVPTEPKEIFGVQFYPQDVITGKAAADAVLLVKKAMQVPDVRFAFVSTGSQQSVDGVLTDLENDDILALSIEKILGSVTYIPMHPGEAWGYLRIFPSSQDNISATDIPVFDELPLDLTVVAGTITKAYQDANSHVNLKSKERDTPNAVMRDASPAHPLLEKFADKPVHMVVTEKGLTLEPTTEAVIQAKLKQRFDKPWQAVKWERTGDVLAFNRLCVPRASDCFKQSARYGGKSANIGFLQHPTVLGQAAQVGSMSHKMGYDLVSSGVAVPLRFYEDLVNDPANTALKAKVDELINKEKAATLTPLTRLKLLSEVQALFYDAKFPEANLAAIKTALAKALPGENKIKVRSSANAEDIEGFDGAGLHDSFTAKVKEKDNPDHSCKRIPEPGDPAGKMEPKSIACAIKGVYASLWNKRAIDERSFARLDHASVSMGIAIVSRYDNEGDIAANAVAVTRVIGSSDIYGYSLSVQKGNNTVTNPEPGTWSEVSIAAFASATETPTFTITRFAKPTATDPQLTTAVIPETKMLDFVRIVQHVETAYCRFKSGYYKGSCGFVTVDSNKPKALDLEVKLLENGEFIFKQVREFAGR